MSEHENENTDDFFFFFFAFDLGWEGGIKAGIKVSL